MKVSAAIHWLSPEEGGRARCLDIGVRYSPHIFVKGRADLERWSIIFHVAPIDDSGNSNITFSMLVKNDATEHFLSQLRLGMEIELLEGMRVVATGVITDFLQ